MGVDGDIASQQAHGVLAVFCDEVVVLLVAQRLDGRGVKALRAAGERQGDGELAHDGLAGAGGSAYEHSPIVLDGLTALELEVIQRVRQGGGKLSKMRRGHSGLDYLPL